jgi:hypothetical protein
MRCFMVGVLMLAATVANAQTLQNQSARLAFDLQTGTYSLAMGKTVAIRNAFATVEGWSSADPACQRKITSRSRDRFTVECTRPDAPTLLLEFTMHPAFLELRAGIRNTTAAPIRIRKFEPLSGGLVFPDDGWSDIRTLDAPSGANQTRVTAAAQRSSPNNLLLTFKQSGIRRSLVMGALKTADFTKWAHTRSVWSNPERLGLRRVGYLDCGGAGADASPFRVVRGRPFSWDGTPDPAGSVLFDEKAVEFEVAQLDPKKRYALGFTWWDKDANGRVESVLVDGQPLVEKRAVPPEPATEIRVLPAESYRDGRLSLAFTNEANVPNAVVSELWLWEADAGVELPTGPTADRVMAAVEAYDPVGKLVEPGETYMPADSFYVDAATANPFEALEQYGRALREATGAKPNPYDFPTVCAWYAGVWKAQGEQNNPGASAWKINTTAGLVEESQKMKESGFLNYSRAAGRLVPDNYTRQNAQGWWDDEHWQQHGFYTAPYETCAKFGAGMHGNGVLAFTYIQPVIQPPQYGNRISLDFRESHKDWLLNKDVAMGGLDYSLPVVQEYVRSRFGAMRGHIDGLMVDYCDDLWMMTMRGQDAEPRLGRTVWETIPANAEKVEFADKRMTATAFYRTFFRCVKDGLGPDSWLHERLLCQPDNDLILGIADSQRTEHDSDKISPELVSRSGLRWYKNRLVIAYDMDSKELTSAWKVGGWTGSDEDGRRMLLTMAYVAASRLLLANSFRTLDAATLHDLERTFPYPTEPRSARPVDAFTYDGWPRVYDFAVTPDWHQVTLFNNALPTREETIAVPLSGDTAEGALGLDPRAEYYVYDFWNDRLIGKFKGTDTLRQTLRPGEARMLSVRKVGKRPQVLSTNRHLMQGYYELSDVKWSGRRLTGKAKVVAGEPLKIVIACNGRQPEELPVSDDGKLAVLTLNRPESETVEWSVEFK